MTPQAKFIKAAESYSAACRLYDGRYSTRPASELEAWEAELLSRVGSRWRGTEAEIELTWIQCELDRKQAEALRDYDREPPELNDDSIHRSHLKSFDIDPGTEYV